MANTSLKRIDTGTYETRDGKFQIDRVQYDGYVAWNILERTWSSFAEQYVMEPVDAANTLREAKIMLGLI